MASLPAEARELIESGALGHLVTLNPDGSAQVTCVWVGLDGGRARLEEGGAPELLQRLARVYLGPDVKFPPMDDPPPGVTMRIEVERVGGIGPWAPH